MKCDSNRFVSASLPCNKHKNRLVHILPIENTRICLTPIRGVEGSDYINASLIDGYRQRGAYIATQGPLQDTTDDFWRMLWEHNSTIVVMLTKLKEMGRVSTSSGGILFLERVKNVYLFLSYVVCARVLNYFDECARARRVEKLDS